jgi:anion transporter
MAQPGQAVMAVGGRGELGGVRRNLGVPLAVILAAAVWFMAAPKGLSLEGQRALALFAGVFVLYLTEAIPLAVTSLMVVPAAVLMHVANVRVALDGFSSASTYLIVGAFILATAMVKTGLAERITYLILLKTGCSPARITLGVTLANIVLAFLVPSATARTALLLPMCLSILSLFGSGVRSKFAVSLLLILAFTNATIGAGILTATVPNPVTVEFLAKTGRIVTYTDWLLYGFPPALLMTLLTWWFVQRIYREKHEDLQEGVDHIIREKLAAMGKTTPAEWRALSVFLLVTLLWATQKWTQFDTTVVALLGDCLLFLPGFGVLKWGDAHKGVSWQVVLVCGGGVSLGDILMRTGAAKWVAVSVFRLLGIQGASTLLILIVVMLILQYMHVLFVGTTAMATAILPIVLAMAEAAHVNPLVLALPAGMIVGGYPLLMFYNTLPNIIVYGTGKLRVGDFPRVGVPLCGVACIVYAICAATYWRWLGLF